MTSEPAIERFEESPVLSPCGSRLKAVASEAVTNSGEE
jgi:hypothetical protein